MAFSTRIQWADSTLNWWIGCAKVSPGCANCYAERSTPSRTLGVGWGRGKPRRLSQSAGPDAEALMRRPWICDYCQRAFGTRKAGEACGCAGGGVPRRRRVFAMSLADWLDPEVPAEWLATFLDVVRRGVDVRWLLLTKRPRLWRARLEAVLASNAEFADAVAFDEWVRGWLKGTPPPQIWLGTSVEDQPRAAERVRRALSIPAAVHWISAEPLLGPLSLARIDDNQGGTFDAYAGLHVAGQRKAARVSWVVVGGESGDGARPCHLGDALALVKEARGAGARVFVKQAGAVPIVDRNLAREFPPESLEAAPNGGDDFRVRLRHSKGGDPSEWPDPFRVLEFPE